MEYRQGVIFVVIQGDKFLVTHPSKGLDTDWYFPGGGFERGETTEETFYREAYEELGLTKSDFISYLDTGISYCYDWPENLVKEKGFLGQQKKYIVSRIRPDAKINLGLTNELDGAKWCTWNELFKVIPFESIKKVLRENEKLFRKAAVCAGENC